MSDIQDRGYAHPEVLVSTDWVAEHLNDPNVRVIESNEDTLLYASGHVPGAVHVDWTSDLNDQIRRSSEVAERKQAADSRRADLCRDEVQGAGSCRRASPRLQGRSAGTRTIEGSAGGRPQP